jgi:hypothetical protein
MAVIERTDFWPRRARRISAQAHVVAWDRGERAPASSEVGRGLPSPQGSAGSAARSGGSWAERGTREEEMGWPVLYERAGNVLRCWAALQLRVGPAERSAQFFCILALFFSEATMVNL